MPEKYVPKGTSVSAPTAQQQEAEFNQARKKTSSAFDRRPITTKDEFIYRIFAVEKPAIDAMIKKGYPVKEILYYWSDVSAEAHAFPIFSSDSVEDIVNRYSDFFPIELKIFAENLADYNKALNTNTGMSDGGDMAIKVKCPIGLYRALLCLDPNFWHDKLNLNRFRKRFSLLVGVGRPK